MLSNQYKILAKLYPDDKDYYEEQAKVLEYGFEIGYETTMQNVYENVMTKEECIEVLDILAMYEALNDHYNLLDDKVGIDKSSLKFIGFDANNHQEIKYLTYARFYCDSSNGGAWKKLFKGEFNSHIMMLPKYQRMLKVWKEVRGQAETLKKQDIISIIKA